MMPGSGVLHSRRRLGGRGHPEEPGDLGVLLGLVAVGPFEPDPALPPGRPAEVIGRPVGRVGPHRDPVAALWHGRRFAQEPSTSAKTLSNATSFLDTIEATARAV